MSPPEGHMPTKRPRTPPEEDWRPPSPAGEGPSSSSSGSSLRGVEEVGEAGGDEFVDVALQKHNALVRSMRGNNRRPGFGSRQQVSLTKSH